MSLYIGQTVRLTSTAFEPHRRLWRRCQRALDMRGRVFGFGKGENTKRCVHVQWIGGREDFLHEMFLEGDGQ